MPAIFISYRRSDSQADAGRIYDRLADHFGKEAVFKDVDDIPAGADFRDFLNRTLNECKVLLAVIGPNWLSAADDQGNRRLDNPADWVRIEIEEALRRKDVVVVPLLVSNARMPRVDELPNVLRELAYRNSRDARPDPDFNKDMNRLMIGLEQYFEQTRKTEQPVVEPRPTASQKSPDQQPLEKYRQEVRQYLQEDNGELSPVSRNLLNELQDFFGLSAEVAMAVEQDELQPYQAKATDIARYQKVYSDALEHESPLSPETRSRLQRFQQTLGLSDDEVQRPGDAINRAIEQALAHFEQQAIDDRATLSRRKVLEWGCLSGVGVIAAVSIGQIFKDRNSFSRLEKLLKAGQWKNADQETLNVMLKIANRESKGWLDDKSLQDFPCDALATIDRLWVDASGGKFGFSVQKKIYVNDCGGQPGGRYGGVAWDCFADKVGWKVNGNWLSYPEVTFDTIAPDGHLPAGLGVGSRLISTWTKLFGLGFGGNTSNKGPQPRVLIMLG